MPDLLVNLYDKRLEVLSERTQAVPATVRPALPPETEYVVDWVRRRFHERWSSEVMVAMAHRPASCLIAIEAGELAGFACFDTTARGFFGPTGVRPESRGRGFGLALLSASLQALKALGHAYAVIGDPGPIQFYVDAVGAHPIPGGDGSLYHGMLRSPQV
ncbi:GNAT family N-acetyltransferase [Aurantimonas sp. MSK8Z-1]|uniref:GNAT family N-acetyltransferase n=1 Tax=Mangrovibrevibacter kandeliae TaxID=2968473 RepID=UPI00211791B6|nr:GNAT family N-acetyltransferase [Aurantimonas sp. MSK8Z-1]MCW4116304.1 GNAT family N-acetyltransferase [Aurantimonas sp. MSK8Z-1]